MTKHALRTILRMPMRTLVCIILIAASALFTSLGTAMLSSSESMAKDADKVYTTTATITSDYDEETGTSSDNFYLDMSEKAGAENPEGEEEPAYDTRFNVARLIESTYCLGFDRRYSLGGYFEGKEITAQFKPYDDFCIVRLKMGEFDRRYGQRVSITDVLFQGNKGIVKLMDGSISYLQGFYSDDPRYYGYQDYYDDDIYHLSQYGTLIPGNYYYVHAIVTRGTLYPVSLPTNVVGTRYKAYASNPLWDCTAWDGVSPSPQYNMFNLLARTYEIVNNAISVYSTTDFSGLTEYTTKTIMLKEGRVFTQQEYDEHAPVIIMTETLAGILGVELGDTIPLSVFSKNGYAYRTKDYTQDNAFLTSQEYTVVGILNKNDEFNTTAYIPTPDSELMPTELDSAEIGTMRIKNGSGDALLKQFENELPESLTLTVYDHGYEAAMRPIKAMRDTAILLTAAGGACAFVLIIVTAFISMRRLRQTADILRQLGTRRIRVMQYMLTSAFILSLIGGAIGAVGANYAFEPVTKRAYSSAQEEYKVDERFSGAYVALSDVSFVPDIKSDIRVIAIVSGGVVAVSVLASLMFVLGITGKQNRSPGQGFGAFIRRLSYGWRVAFRSLRRRFAQSLAAVLVVLILVSFIGWFGGEISNADARLSAIHDNTEVTARITSMNGRASNSLRIDSSEIQLVKDTGFVRETYLTSTQIGRVTGYFVPINNATETRSTRSSLAPLSDDLIQDYSGVGSASGFYDPNYSDGQYGDGEYGDDGTEPSASTNPEIPAPTEAPTEKLIPYTDLNDNLVFGGADSSQDIMDWSDIRNIKNAFKTSFASDIMYAPEFIGRNKVDIEYLDGFDSAMFAGHDNVCALSREYMKKRDLQLGDKVQVSVYFKLGVYSDEYVQSATSYDKEKISFDVVIAACYDSVRETASGGNSESIVYLPIGLFPEGGGKEETIYIGTGVYDEYGILVDYEELTHTYMIPLVDYYSSAVFTLNNTRKLSDFRDKLTEAGFAIKGGTYKLRLSVSIDDTNLNNSITAFLKHQKLMTVLYFAMFIIAAGMGFGISCLLTKGRKQEAAILRGLGTGWFPTLRVYVLEQLMLCIIGTLIGCGAIYLITGGLFDGRLMGVGIVALCYLAGNLISIIMMNRLDVLKMLAAKE